MTPQPRRGSPERGPGWTRTPVGWAYRIASRTAVAAASALLRLTGDAARRRDLAERLASPDTLSDLPHGAIWAHAASMGEVRALLPLARSLAEVPGTPPLFVTTQSTTGRRLARDLGYPATLSPGDAPSLLGPFLDALRPRLHLVVETEIWPWRLLMLSERGIPSSIVSARLSPRRWPRYRRLRSFYGPVLRQVDLVCPAGPADRERFLALGVSEARIGPEGNLKWDGAPPPADPGDASQLRKELGLDPALAWIVLGSCHPGEAAPFADLARGGRGALLVAPRHPERFDDLLRELQKAGLAPHRASRGPAPPGCRVVLLDRMGTLVRSYPLAAAATLGGTFAKVGGHSPLEAAAAGCPLVSGPHDEAQTDLVVPLATAGGLVRCASARSAREQLAAWLDDEAARLAAGRAAQREVQARRGVSRSVAGAIVELLR